MPSPMPWKMEPHQPNDHVGSCNICCTRLLEGEWVMRHNAVLEGGGSAIAHLECVRYVVRAEYVSKLLRVGHIL